MAKILDCTMRDGGYYNDWSYSPTFSQSYLNTLGQIGVEYAELGFRILKEAGHRGPWAYTPDSLINTLSIPNGMKLGVMVNASEIIHLDPQVIKKVFRSDSQVKFVRIACHFSELSEVAWATSFLKSLGLEVGLNLMQTSERTADELKIFAEISEKDNVHMLYLADSLGAMSTDSVEFAFQVLNAETGIPKGFHGHDNRGLAHQNSITAVDNGSEFIDGTMLGMGRGAGNAKTEDLFLSLEAKPSIEAIVALNQFLGKFMYPLRETYDWGASFEYRIAAQWGIHPTYVQELISEHGHSALTLEKIVSLSRQNSSRFNSELLRPQTDQALAIMKSISLANIDSGSAVIVGGGSSAVDHLPEIEHFANEKRSILMTLNDAWHEVSQAKLGGFNVRTEISSLESLANEKFGLISPGTSARNPRKNESFIPRRIVSGKWDHTENYVITPNGLTLSYALQVAASLNIDEIYLAGIDGYPNDIRNAQIMQTLLSFIESHPGIQVRAITPTIFPIEYISAYWRG